MEPGVFPHQHRAHLGGGYVRRECPAPRGATRANAVRSCNVGLAIAAAVVGIVFIPLTQTPEAFPQQPDTIFHLGVVQWMRERGDISSLHAAGFSSASGTGFYPAAFHGVVATLAQLSGASATVSTSAFVLVVAAVIWPLGAMMLSRVVLGPGPAVVISAAVTSVMFSAFPFWLLGYGVLWPNLLGYALLPTALALVVAAIAPEQGIALGQRHAVLLLVLALPGFALAHPNVLIALIGFGALIVSERALGHLWQMHRRRPRAAARGPCCSWWACCSSSSLLLCWRLGRRSCGAPILWVQRRACAEQSLKRCFLLPVVDHVCG